MRKIERKIERKREWARREETGWVAEMDGESKKGPGGSRDYQLT